MLIEEGKKKGGKKEGIISGFFIANTLFLSGREVKRQKHISAQPLPRLRQGVGGHSCHFILFSLVYLLIALFPSTIFLLFYNRSHSMTLTY